MNSISTTSMVQRQDISSKLAASRRHSIRKGMLALLAVVGISMIYIGMRIDVVNMGYESNELKKEVTKLQETKEKIKSEVESLKSPARLRVIAENELGMRPPKGDEILFVGRSDGAN